MIYDSPLLWLQEKNTDVWEMLMIELVRCRKNRVNDEFDKKWEEFKNTKDFWYDWMRWNNSRDYIRFITNHKYYMCEEYESIKYKFRNKLFVYGFEIRIIEPEEHPNIHNPIDLMYFIGNTYYNYESKVKHLIKLNNHSLKEDMMNVYSNNYFKFMCLQEEMDNCIVYCDIEKKYIREYKV